VDSGTDAFEFDLYKEQTGTLFNSVQLLMPVTLILINKNIKY